MGPAAGARLFQRIVELTQAERDCDHLDVTVLSDPSIPDRTQFLKRAEGSVDFTTCLQDKARILSDMGCEVIAIPCNTSHARFDAVAAAVPAATLIHMPRETALFARAQGCRRPFILATDGAVQSNIFQKACSAIGIGYILPSSQAQQMVTDVIYRYAKAGRPVPSPLIQSILSCGETRDADGIILGCTELSLVGFPSTFDALPVFDSLDVLAWRSVQACGGTAVDLAAAFAASHSSNLQRTTNETGLPQ